MTPFFKGSGGPRGVIWPKNFFTKICPKRCSRHLRSLGGLRKAVFWQLKFLIEGGALCPPRCRRTVKSACSQIWLTFIYIFLHVTFCLSSHIFRVLQNYGIITKKCILPIFYVKEITQKLFFFISQVPKFLKFVVQQA